MQVIFHQGQQGSPLDGTSAPPAAPTGPLPAKSRRGGETRSSCAVCLSGHCPMPAQRAQIPGGTGCNETPDPARPWDAVGVDAAIIVSTFNLYRYDAQL